MATNGAITADPLSNEPHTLWEQHWSKERKCHKVNPPLSLGAPIKDNAVRFVCISDTHEQLGRVIPRIPDGDVLVHCGDFTNFGDEAELRRFNDELGQLPHKYKIVIAGNHDLGFEDDEDESKRLPKYKDRGTKQGYKLLTNCIYLHDSFTTVYGLKVYGSSWHPLEGYSFTRSRGEDMLSQWRKIPSDVDVLLTHTPPLGHSDLYKGERWGDADLLNVIERQDSRAIDPLEGESCLRKKLLLSYALLSAFLLPNDSKVVVLSLFSKASVEHSDTWLYELPSQDH